MNLSKNAKLTKVKGYQSAATSEVKSDVVDMQNWDGVVFLASIGTANTGNKIKAQQGAESDLSDAADLEGTSIASDGTQTAFVLDIYRPRERYLWAVITRGASTTVEAIWAIQYRGRKMPVTNTTTSQAAETHVSPAEGTA